MSEIVREWQFDGLVGPTHNYAGLALGNVASAKNAGAVSNPRAAALQGIEKMKFVRDLGIPQAVLPPHFRPRLDVLRQLGFGGTRAKMLEDAARLAPGLLASVYSSAFMWTANAATVSASADTADGRVHFTIANLMSHFHRSIEPDFAFHSLSKIFNNTNHFAVHPALPATEAMSDEGAANHMRLSSGHGVAGSNLFVYGKSSEDAEKPFKFPARQHRLACEAVARLHGLDPAQTLFLQQSPAAIDAGVFHNDVIALSTGNKIIIHELALIPAHRELLRAQALAKGWQLREVQQSELSLEDAVKSYFFNSQYLRLQNGDYTLVAPKESEENHQVSRLVHALHTEGMFAATHHLEVRESMKNGGGPACLRLRVPLSAVQESHIHPGIILTDSLYTALTQWVKSHYRDRMCFEDFCDPNLWIEINHAYDALERILGLPELYTPFRDACAASDANA